MDEKKNHTRVAAALRRRSCRVKKHLRAALLTQDVQHIDDYSEELSSLEHLTHKVRADEDDGR